MTLKNFFVGRAIVLTAILILGGGIYLYASSKPAQLPAQSVTVPKNVTKFVWVYEADSSMNAYGQPQTNISVDVSYDDGSLWRYPIHTVPMGCNDVPELEPDNALNSTAMQCYAAGLGYTYKIAKGEASYLVQRKAFEEALPDQTPVTYEYHVVSEILF